MRKLIIILIAAGAILFYENIVREPLTESIIESTLEAKYGWVYDPNYNPLDTLRGTKHEGDRLSDYAGMPNDQATRALMARKDRQAIDRATLAAAGFPGAIAGLVAMVLDPVIAIIVVAAWLLSRGRGART
jgi:hypothetical protein